MRSGFAPGPHLPRDTHTWPPHLGVSGVSGVPVVPARHLPWNARCLDRPRRAPWACPVRKNAFFCAETKENQIAVKAILYTCLPEVGMHKRHRMNEKPHIEPKTAMNARKQRVMDRFAFGVPASRCRGLRALSAWISNL